MPRNGRNGNGNGSGPETVDEMRRTTSPLRPLAQSIEQLLSQPNMGGGADFIDAISDMGEKWDFLSRTRWRNDRECKLVAAVITLDNRRLRKRKAEWGDSPFSDMPSPETQYVKALAYVRLSLEGIVRKEMVMVGTGVAVGSVLAQNPKGFKDK